MSKQVKLTSEQTGKPIWIVATPIEGVLGIFDVKFIEPDPAGPHLTRAITFRTHRKMIDLALDAVMGEK